MHDCVTAAGRRFKESRCSKVGSRLFTANWAEVSTEISPSSHDSVMEGHECQNKSSSSLNNCVMNSLKLEIIN